MEDDRVVGIRVDAVREGTLDGVALREGLDKVGGLLRSRTFREKDGNRLSILLVMLFADDATDRRRLNSFESS
jgi:hypothetical protein